jgi:tetratricopeptide (TPR) repeat protein
LLAITLPLQAAAQSHKPAVAPDLAAPAQLILHKQYAQAEALLRKLLPQHQNQAELHVMLAYALFRDNKPAESLKEYTRAAQLRHPTAEDLKWVALDYVLLNDYKDAETWMYQSLRMNPKNEMAWYSMGRILYTRNLFKKAQICFQQALKLNPRSVDAENNLGLTYEGLYKWDDAIAAYQQAIAWQKDSPHPSEEPLLNLGIIYLDQNHLDKALPLLQQAYAIDPNSKRILKQLARANYRLGHYADAESELRAALRKTPKDGSLHFLLGRVLSKEGKKAEAKAEFAIVAKLDGTHSDSH